VFHVEQIDLLSEAFDKEAISYTPDLLSRFNVYLNLLMKWSRSMGLISKRDESRLVTRHLLPSAGLVHSVVIPDSCTVLDLGSGGGLPGIPMKLMRPDLHVILVESKKKKAQFLRVVLRELSLTSIDVIEERVEDLPGEIETVDIVVSRAVADLATLAQWCRGILKSEGGRLIVMKGAAAEEEMKALETSSLAPQIKHMEAASYNPFPGTYSLDNSYLVDIIMGGA
jgi:16S rRNA (guanine527-N7)-methyltransferase